MDCGERLSFKAVTLVANPAAPGTMAGAVIEWTCDPWRENARVASLSAVSALVLCLVVAALREPFVVTVALVVICVAAFAPAITPVRCRADERGVARRGMLGWEHREWSSVRRLEVLPAALLVSPYSRRHWLDAQRGLSLPLPADRREELLRRLGALWEAYGKR